MRITSLQTQVNNPDRINIFVDEHFLLGANAMLVLQMSLHVGQEITPAQVEQIQQEEALQQSVDRALNYLSFRPRSRQEVRNYLRRKGTTPEHIQVVLERLDRMDLVNDRSFASFWLENREQFSPKGAQALKNELRQKGIQREVIDELVDEENDEGRAQRAAEKKARSLLRQPSIDYATFYRRLGSFLQRRGFSFEITKRIVKRIWEEQRQETVGEEE
ncbi:regulatory protein RecX [Ktedonobacter sp. SOSP1-85]|jgi:regulatory protein|uniref:Regulatory protein RecX n=1 Tax=Ktedonobacter racemifer DSM 44963 TaxID=485913 RepID=D6TQF5_KTERA|nr:MULTISPECIES: RecX family transcriptional regulator [Ktedonobacter]EFH87622.1 regulatory protein RecX [Ktedonobacter racemifer DSM 44963]GHO75104.1 regulatory protein RecX [Ktedonobacter sp. SOSP1-85]